MRRVLVHLDLDVVRHDEAFPFDDAAMERLIGSAVGSTLPRRLGAGDTGLRVPDGKGGFVAKPAVLLTVKKVGIEALPEEAPESTNGHTQDPPIFPRIVLD